MTLGCVDDHCPLDTLVKVGGYTENDGCWPPITTLKILGVLLPPTSYCPTTALLHSTTHYSLLLLLLPYFWSYFILQLLLILLLLLLVLLLPLLSLVLFLHLLSLDALPVSPA